MLVRHTLYICNETNFFVVAVKWKRDVAIPRDLRGAKHPIVSVILPLDSHMSNILYIACETDLHENKEP